jgi:hypothetical protein
LTGGGCGCGGAGTGGGTAADIILIKNLLRILLELTPNAYSWTGNYRSISSSSGDV